ncbi:MAG: DUF2642 domain-containing protein [Ectobacillus sp.]
MIDYNKHMNDTIQINLSGNMSFTGTLIDKGSHILVIYENNNFIYLPLLHIQQIQFDFDNQSLLGGNQRREIAQKEEAAPDALSAIPSTSNTISLRKVLQNAKGMFLELCIGGEQTLHGYVVSVMNDYFIFYSPVYHIVYIPFYHVKWFVPYKEGQVPYSLEREEFPLRPAMDPLARTFEEQLKRFIGKIIILNLGKKPLQIGRLNAINSNQLELVIARNETIYVNLHHVKSVHLA